MFAFFVVSLWLFFNLLIYFATFCFWFDDWDVKMKNG